MVGDADECDGRRSPQVHPRPDEEQRVVEPIFLQALSEHGDDVILPENLG